MKIYNIYPVNNDYKFFHKFFQLNLNLEVKYLDISFVKCS